MQSNLHIISIYILLLPSKDYNTLIINIVIFVVCGGISYILRYHVTLFIPKIGSIIDCVVYTGMYNFMKEIPVYIFVVKNHCLH